MASPAVERVDDGAATSGHTADRILALSCGYWASRTILSAFELGVFRVLTDQPLTLEELCKNLGLNQRGARDLLDALVVLGLLEREQGVYRNGPEAAAYLDDNKPEYIGGYMRFHNELMYPSWAGLTESIRTGTAHLPFVQENDPWSAAYLDPDRVAGVVTAMSNYSSPSAVAISDQFDWSLYKTVCDVGTAQGMLPSQVLRRHAHLRAVGFDLPPVEPHFRDFMSRCGLESRADFVGGSFLTDTLPPADVFVMGHVLCDWGMDVKKLLLQRAWESLPAGGALIVHDTLIDDDRRANLAGMLMSLNILVMSAGGFEYTGAECQEWMREAGFTDTFMQHLTGREYMVVGVK